MGDSVKFTSGALRPSKAGGTINPSLLESYPAHRAEKHVASFLLEQEAALSCLPHLAA